MKNAILGLFFATAALSACSDKAADKPADAPKIVTPSPAMPAAPTPAAPAAVPAGGAVVAAMDPVAEAAQVFEQRCTLCHGAGGKGDGAAAAGLNPKPRDYTDGAWQKSVKDEELAKAILEGGAAVGKSAAMPPNPDLKEKPEVIKALVAKVRSFAPKG